MTPASPMTQLPKREGEMTPDRYVQAVKVKGPRGAWKVMQKFGPGVLAFSGPSKDGMTKTDADYLARHIAGDGTGFVYLKPEGTR